jgi:uncharacterized membrane protein YdjX (TVP38/TMEM64 family)
MGKSSTPRLILLGAAAAGVIAALVVLPVKDYLRQLVAWLEELGPWGAVLLALIYILATVLGVPGTILSLGAGFAFGVVVGTIVISIGSTLGAAAAFLVGRYLARGLVEQRLGNSPRLRAIDQAVAAHGFKIVLLTRLSPAFPFNVLNYAFSLTRVSFRDYVLASWIGMLPGTVMYVYLGSVVGNLAELAAGMVEKGPEYYVLLAVGLVATVVVTVYVTRLAHKALAEAAPGAEHPSAQGREEDSATNSGSV